MPTGTTSKTIEISVMDSLLVVQSLVKNRTADLLPRPIRGQQLLTHAQLICHQIFDSSALYGVVFQRLMHPHQHRSYTFFSVIIDYFLVGRTKNMSERRLKIHSVHTTERFHYLVRGLNVAYILEKKYIYILRINSFIFKVDPNIFRLYLNLL